MNDETKMILQMLSDGKINSDEAANLLKAIAGTQPRSETRVEYTESDREAVREASRRARQEAKEAARAARETLREELRKAKEVAREAAREAKERLREERGRILEEAKGLKERVLQEVESAVDTMEDEMEDLEDLLEHEDEDEDDEDDDGEHLARSPRIKRAEHSMSHKFGRFGSMLGGLFSGLGGDSYRWQEELSGEFVGAEVPRVIIRGVNGRVAVETSDDDKWHLLVEKSINASSEREAKAQADDLYTLEESAEGLIILARKVFGQSRTVHFHLRLPSSRLYNIDLSSTNGSVRVRDVRTEVLRATTTNGKVEVMCEAKDIHLSSTNGRIELSGCGQVVQCRTVNGRIVVSCLAPVAGNMSLTTVNGGITMQVGKIAGLGVRFVGSNTHGGVRASAPDLHVDVERRTVGKKLRAESKGSFDQWLTIEARSVHGPINLEQV